MSSRTEITHVVARQVYDSRGRPTVEADVTLGGGAFGRAMVPSGASTGTHEAHELRDGDQTNFSGLTVHRAVDNIRTELAQALLGQDCMDQTGLDERILAADGTPTLSRLGANAALAVSLAASRASAVAASIPLYRRIAEISGNLRPTVPMPMVNILSGGLHARAGMDIQDFLVVPLCAETIEDAVRISFDVRAAAAHLLEQRGITTLLADEGGLSPGFTRPEDALECMTLAIEKAGLQPGQDAAIAIDVAASTFYLSETSQYSLRREGKLLTSDELIARLAGWVDSYPIASIEDALSEDDWSGWSRLTQVLGTRVQLIGDDLFTTNLSRLRTGIAEGCANGVLIKLNQNGTLTGTIEVARSARAAGYTTVISARSGETEDPYISDLAVGIGGGQIKIGSVRTSDRLAKYNQLIRIGEDSLPFDAFPTLGRSQK